MFVSKNQLLLENTLKDILNIVFDVFSKVVEMNIGVLFMFSIYIFMLFVQVKSLENNSGLVIKEKKGNVFEEVGLIFKTVFIVVLVLKDNGKNSRKFLLYF